MKVFVTGSAGGIGRAIAEKFLKEGHTVFGLDIQESGLDHPAYTHLSEDVRTVPLAGLPDAEIVIHCAGTQEDKDAIEVNLNAVIRLAEHLKEGPSLRSELFIASASARTGAEFPRYAASKGGLVAYMKNQALKLAKRGITVNSISPGGVITASNRHILESEELYAAVKAETLLGKWAQPEEIAELAYFLTVINRSITGEDILIDNGEMLKSNFIW